MIDLGSASYQSGERVEGYKKSEDISAWTIVGVSFLTGITSAIALTYAEWDYKGPDGQEVYVQQHPLRKDTYYVKNDTQSSDINENYSRIEEYLVEKIPENWAAKNEGLLRIGRNFGLGLAALIALFAPIRVRTDK